MPAGVKILIRLTDRPSKSGLDDLREKLRQDLGLEQDDFYVDGALAEVTGEDLLHMPVSGGIWFEVNLWRSYYGVGYERGDIELFVRCAEWLEQHLYGCEIFYGHDVDDKSIELFDQVVREKYTAYYRKVGSEPYDTKDAKRAEELRALWE